MTMIRGSDTSNRRKEYIDNLKMRYGIIVEEFRQKDGQRCGYFHMRFPIFQKGQKPGDEPQGFTPSITEYTEWVMKRVVSKVLEDDWYREMCEEWSNNHSIVGENIWED